MEDFSGIDFIGVCFWAWSAYFRTGVIVRELHSDRILADLDRARRQGKTLGRPKKVIDVENAEMQRRKGGDTLCPSALSMNLFSRQTRRPSHNGPAASPSESPG